MKRKIKANPFIGTKEGGDIFQYKEGRFTIRYAIIRPKTPKEKIIPRWISVKIKPTPFKLALKKINREFADFWNYHKWLILLHPSTIGILIFIGLIIYIGGVELQPGKGYLIRWLASRATGVSANEIEYRGSGWIRLSGSRTKIDKEREYLNYDVNVFRWLVFNDAGSVTRYRGRPDSTVIEPLGYDERGEVYLKKEGKWQKGEISEGKVEWDKPLDTVVKDGRLLPRRTTVETTEEGKLEVRDK